MTASGPDGKAARYTPLQRAAIQANEEQATLELVEDTVNRLNRLGDRLERFLDANNAIPRGES